MIQCGWCYDDDHDHESGCGHGLCARNAHHESGHGSGHHDHVGDRVDGHVSCHLSISPLNGLADWSGCVSDHGSGHESGHGSGHDL